ncbi:MAG: tetratricopeptide repeat protein [Longimicrobiales bacterium]|nr:tetratricopeptide repeat protein [Longimicrobiales bacterium]
MYRSRWTPLFFVLAVAGCATTPTEMPVPAEPLALPGGIENPSAWDYFRHGERIFEDSPGEAAEAFYWAMRRDPTWATPIFARRLALFLVDDYLFGEYLSGSRRALRNPYVQQLDSLYLRALKLNPFLDRRLDARALKELWRLELIMRLQREYPGAPVGEIEMAVGNAVEQYAQRASDRFKGMLAHGEGRFRQAAAHYGSALEDDPDDIDLLARRATVLFRSGRHEAAIEHLRMAIAELREQDEDELQRVYYSKAMYLHAIGLVHEDLGDRSAARDAYAEALQEDLSYHPAHVRLAELALAAGDTMTAVSEMRLAAEIAPDEASVLMSYGRLLEATGQLAEAEATFRHVTEVEPLFAAPCVRLARVLDRQDRPGPAVAAYRLFLERAAHDESGLPEARARLQELEEALATGTAAAGGSP